MKGLNAIDEMRECATRLERLIRDELASQKHGLVGPAVEWLQEAAGAARCAAAVQEQSNEGLEGSAPASNAEVERHVRAVKDGAHAVAAPSIDDPEGARSYLRDCGHAINTLLVHLDDLDAQAIPSGAFVVDEETAAHFKESLSKPAGPIRPLEVAPLSELQALADLGMKGAALERLREAGQAHDEAVKRGPERDSCRICNSVLLYSSQRRGDGLCGPCSRGSCVRCGMVKVETPGSMCEACRIYTRHDALVSAVSAPAEPTRALICGCVTGPEPVACPTHARRSAS